MVQLKDILSCPDNIEKLVSSIIEEKNFETLHQGIKQCKILLFSPDLNIFAI